MPNILFRADAHKTVGTGDLMSLIYLSSLFRARGWGCYFAVRDFEASKRIVHNLALENVSWVPSGSSIAQEIYQVNRICIDISADCFFMEVTGQPLSAYAALGRPAPIMACVNFDGVLSGDFDLVVNWCIDAADEAYSGHSDVVVLKGFENTVLPDYLDRRRITNRTYSTVVRRILITMGGIDEFDLTGRILEVISRLRQNYQVRVIAGPGYKLRATGFAGVMFKENSCNLFTDYLWADIAFSAGGLTSSELIASHTPALLIASYPHQVKRCQYYAKCGWAYYLGQQDKVDADVILAGLSKVIDGISDYHLTLSNLNFWGSNEKIFEIIDSYRQSRKLV